MLIKKYKKEILAISAIFILAGLYIIFYYLSEEKTSEEKTPVVKIEPAKEILINKKGQKWGPLPAGAQTYRVMTHDKIFPKFIEITIDPLDVQPGDMQKMKVVLADKVEIISAIAEIETNNSTTTVSLNRSSEKMTNAGLKNFVYDGSWVVHDTHRKTYHTIFRAKNSEGQKNSFIMAWSDPCSGIPLGGNGTLSANCVVSGIDGIDNGSLNLNGYTITINSGAIFVWNPGQGITTNGSIAIASGGQLKQTYLWVQDNDNDAYSPGTAAAQDSQPAGYRRRYTVASLSDCNDANAGVWQYLTGYTDSDGDGYAGSGAQSICSGASLPAGYTTNPSSDCYDANANAFPGQTSYFPTHRGDGSYDYNCDGVASRQEDRVDTRTKTPSGYYLSTYDDFRFGPGAMCQDGEFGGYADSLSSYSYSCQAQACVGYDGYGNCVAWGPTVACRHNSIWYTSTSCGGGQGWCIGQSYIEWIDCYRNAWR